MSYGSGCAASMYGLEVTVSPAHKTDALTRLTLRQSLPIEDTLLLVGAFEMTHGRFGYTPSAAGCCRGAGAYYLRSVGVTGLRRYGQHRLK